jgi:thymidylate synthase (FAD)
MVTDPRLKVVNAARVSFNKESRVFDESDKKLTRYLYDHGHFSTYRHSYFTFRMKVPLFVFRQWWKYQIGSAWTHDDLSRKPSDSTNDENLGVSIEIPETNWNEQSGRYTEFKPEFYIPHTLRKQSKSNKQGTDGTFDETQNAMMCSWLSEDCDRSFVTYQRLVSEGVGKEIARMVLPQNIYSECIWTCSLQTLIYFFQQRLKDDAQYEIREYAWAVYMLMYPFAKELIEFKDAEGYTWWSAKMREIQEIEDLLFKTPIKQVKISGKFLDKELIEAEPIRISGDSKKLSRAVEFVRRVVCVVERKLDVKKS